MLLFTKGDKDKQLKSLFLCNYLYLKVNIFNFELFNINKQFYYSIYKYIFLYQIWCSNKLNNSYLHEILRWRGRGHL